MLNKLSNILIIIMLIICIIISGLLIAVVEAETYIEVAEKSADEIENNYATTVIDALTETDFLKTDGTKIVNQNGEQVVLKGYNLGLWLSRSFWGLPIDATYNTNDEIRHSDVNNTEIYYELFKNQNEFTYDQIQTLNEAFYENYITTADMDKIFEIGANVVRLPFEWSFFMKPQYDEENDKVYWKDDTEYFEKKLDFLEKKINELGERGIYVILDFHIAPGGQNKGGYRENPSFFKSDTEGLAESNQALALKIWRNIAGRFYDNPVVAGYDLINEPGGVDFQDYIVPFYNEAYKTIRDQNDNHIIIMETKFNCYETEGNLPKPSDIGWENVVYSTHDYFWDREDANGDSETGNMTDKVAPEKEELKRRIYEYTSKSIEMMKNYYEVPLYIGEFNHLETNTETIITNNEEVWSYAFDIYNKNNVNYTAWTYKAGWDPYMGMVYYGRKDFTYEKDGIVYDINLGGADGKKINLKTDSYDDIYAVFSATSDKAMNFNQEFYDICKKNFEIKERIWDISATSSDSIQATLSTDGILTISGSGNMISTWTINNQTPWYAIRERIKSVKIEDGVTNIGRLAFNECTELTSIEISNSVTNIGHSAFFKCSSLKSIEIKGSVTSIGNDAFFRCSSLENIYVYASNPNYVGVNGVLYNKEKTKIIKYPEGKQDAEYTISSAVTSIEEHAFLGSALTSIIIPKEVTEIGTDAFAECNNLTIICKSETAIETYVIENGIPYLLDKGFPEITFTNNGTDETVKSANTKVTVEDIGTETVTGIDYTNLKYYWGKRSEGVSKSEIVTKFLKDQTITTPKQQGIYYLWILARDKVGNEKIQTSNAFYIDAIAPKASVKTSSDGTVIITANEEIQEIEGWTLSEDKLILTKKYTETKSETVIIKDLIGNETELLIEVVINEVKLEYDVQYSTKSLTNKDVTVTITTNEEIQEVEGWLLSTDKLILTKVYMSNTMKEGENVILKDLAGNETTVNIKITNIDKNAPKIILNTQVGANTIKVDIEATDEIAGIDQNAYRYFIKEVNATYETGVINGPNYTFSDLKASTTYYIKVEVSDKIGNTANKEIEITTLEADEITPPRPDEERGEETPPGPDYEDGKDKTTIEGTTVVDGDNDKDDTTAKKEYEKAGISTTLPIIIAIVTVAVVAIITYTKNKNYEDIL